MPKSRPAVVDRWEFQLGLALLGLGLAALRSREAAPASSAAERWRSGGHEDSGDPVWVVRMKRERQVLSAAVGLWMAWRSYRLERGQRTR